MFTRFLFVVLCLVVAPALAAEPASLGVEVIELATVYDVLREKGFDLPTKSGLIVLHVTPNSPAAKAKISPDDIILKVQRTTVRTIDDLRTALEGTAGKEIDLSGYGSTIIRGKQRWRRGDLRVTPATREEILKGAMVQTADPIKGLTFWKHASAPEFLNSRTAVYCYIAEEQGAPTLRLKLQYVADDWLFIKSLVVRAGAENFTIDLSGFSDVERDNSGGKIWEWHDRPVGANEMAMLRAMATGGNAIIAFNGNQYRKDFELDDTSRHVISETLELYDMINTAE
ncbi:PDZ domain-containing protein [Rubinisphaera margarita]|uniref:PDZ domain-containing protein n=1 Tax=Rubinisphaera margarita TaxID=2909586 RepID=UPI001EE90832|nr:PDZ domain-containing protein [Rubinisphaera margarita]MCG6154995.1 PDZ domain-containing protein [Rubinisphaera margarita]